MALELQSSRSAGHPTFSHRLPHMNPSPPEHHQAPGENTSSHRIAAWRAYVLTLFVPAFVLAGMIASFHMFTYRAELREVRGKDSAFVATAREALRREFVLVTSDLAHVIEPELRRFLESDEAWFLEDLEAEFVSLSGTKRLYDQVRYIEVDGQELVRVNLIEGLPSLVHSDHLQNKAGRYYFDDTIALEPGQIFVSPMDLNVEHGEVERPLKPMLRFGTAVADRAGVKRGVVLLNYLAENLLDHLSSIPGSAGSLSLLNGDGYWLLADDPKDEWGFMFGNDRSFASRYPDIWTEMQGSESGQVVLDNGIVTFTTVHPLSEGQRSSSGSTEAYEPSAEDIRADAYRWKLLSHFTSDQLSALKATHWKWGAIQFLLISLILGPGVFQIARTRMRISLEREALRASRQRYSAVTDSIRDAIVGADPDGKIIAWNRAAESIFGLHAHEAMGRPLNELVLEVEPVDSSAGEVDVSPSTSPQRGVLCRGKRADGSEFPAESLRGTWEDSGRLFTSYVIRDITRRRELEAERAELERGMQRMRQMQAIGQLAGGAAHEINTPIQFIQGNLRFLEGVVASLPQGDEIIEEADAAIAESIEGVEHVRAIVRALSNFAKPPTEGKKEADLNQIVETALVMCETQWSEAAEFTAHLDPDLPGVLCCESEISQMIVSLLANAAQAIREMEGGSRGHVNISTHACNDGVELRVEDSGGGIPLDVQPRVFDPFFSTREVGQGVGQGLTVCQDIIVSKHAGDIHFDSTPGSGTVFTVKLPAHGVG